MNKYIKIKNAFELPRDLSRENKYEKHLGVLTPMNSFLLRILSEMRKTFNRSYFCKNGSRFLVAQIR